MKTKKLITQKEAKAAGVIISKAQKLDRVKFYRLDNGNIIDSNGDIRFLKNTPQERLDYLRQEIQQERISTAEILELESLKEYIDPSDVLLLEWAGVPEFEK